ncbi:ABC transporter family substrate-binding protein [Nocardia asteroides NBRC 15531]|uniref:ABC transporter substrate-binding protein n=1 Tax=Nocardia asteroides NBRC 15531 TaxID=1110697 RepID=U5EC41_NOCAS|nr:ABC transporter family substrate-binding protein [Nocardia asteroides]TLF68954.1 ABC transporter family substrate-binding protein [Nocardia asteroides NBRC 15531]UGT48422.1 ABC transporter family substrate-binding protein [Nocardia asteroides]SFL59190.1 peptide/nickel transport system substrate-binding protein [Nocardia asteroides]VEG32298.1 Probable monoacyl phosphatidylinositol tetramannoside-binding protein LpqW precursor [Nocardia asteroides]GAD84925.1 putative ABC transporter substrate
MTTATYVSRLRRVGFRVAAPAVALSLVLGGCGSNSTVESQSSAIGAINDINPQERDALREGGNLRLSLTSFPETFNSLHVDSDGEVSDVTGWTLPGSINSDAAGNLTIDHNYYTDVQLTNTNPQQIVYTINPKAVWSDGSPITWEDLRAQAAVMSGRDPAFKISHDQGYSSVEKVERGVDDRQAIVTFAEHYAEWKGLFNPLYPRQLSASTQSFDDLYRSEMPLSSGPFIITSIDRAQQRIVLSRNPKWWGDATKLDTVTYSVLADEARLTALQNNELDAAGLSGIDEVTTATGTPGIKVRRAPANRFSHFTFNGAPGSLLSDPKLRIAISKGIDRQAIATATQQGIVTDPKPLNNHLFLVGQKGYQDNAESVSYDPAEAARMLDELGWKLNGDVREKDGRKLEIRDVMYQADTWTQMAQIAQQNLAAIGVKLKIETYPGSGLFTDVIDPGNFDIAQFVWSKSIFPLGALPQIYAYDPANPLSNKGRIGSPELNALIEEVIAELDPEKAIELANKADRMIFEEGFSLPIVQSAGTVAVRDTLANYGAPGLASYDYTKVGFVK